MQYLSLLQGLPGAEKPSSWTSRRRPISLITPFILGRIGGGFRLPATRIR
jgi:hypothetical protein